MKILEAIRRWRKRRALRRAQRRLHDVRTTLGTMAMMAALGGSKVTPTVEEFVQGLFREQQQLIDECERLGAELGLEDPCGEEGQRNA